jgi:peroxiredoxin
LELEALNDSFDEINRMRAGLIAISPQKPSINHAVKRKLGLKYEVFSDVGLTPRSLGLVFELPLRLQKSTPLWEWTFNEPMQTDYGASHAGTAEC